MQKSGRRTPKGYDGINITGHKLGEVLPFVLKAIGRTYQSRGDLIMRAWPEIIGNKLACMTEAVSFEDDVLVVKVRSSTLYSLLCQEYRTKLLKILRERFPGTAISNIVFRIN